ncbi:hypothetical protein PENSTE_c012G09455 [Penicillium steckii]|uniref:Amine oxidase n=1 Tax=Penicillium steckii TaxID=303698 RepID=A0A1V6T5M9_9EURO|nr:hypothetical protein PENSTE_c012G09455 [Penicillium steckii]
MFDVVVIGAGFSGLQAAYTAKQAGLSVSVIEARDRVGGKIWSVPLASGRGFAELGGAWVNDSLQPRVWAYAQKFGLEVVKQRLEGKAVMQESENERFEFPFGTTPEFTPSEKKNLEFIRDHFQAESLKKGLPSAEVDNVSLDQYVRSLGALPKIAKMVNLWSQVMHGLESTEESAAWFIDYCRRNKGFLAIRADDSTGGQYLRFQDGLCTQYECHERKANVYLKGAQSIAQGLSNLLGNDNIHLSCPVKATDNYDSHVTITTRNGKIFQAKKCIVSVPSTMYKEFNFTPALPVYQYDELI